MQQRRPRLGDVLDDYCPRERRVTNHVVVAMIEDQVKQTRCTTCDGDHDYKQARTPSPRKAKPVAAIQDGKLLRTIALPTTVLIYVQHALGATMRHQHRDLSITDFPTAYGQWIPDTSPAAIAAINAARDRIGMSDVSAAQIWLQMLHRFGAVLVAIGVIWFFLSAHREKISPLRGLSIAWLIGVFVQIALGAWTIWSNKAADVATTHVAVGATMLGLGAIICAFCFHRTERSVSQTQQLRSDPAIV